MVRVIFGRQIDIGASPALFRAPAQAPVKPVMVVVDESDGATPRTHRPTG